MFCNTNTEFVPVATNNNDGMGSGTWLFAIILFFGLLVFGGNGWFGNRGNNGGGIDTATAAILSSLGNRGASADAIATDAAVQRGFDTQSIIGKLDGISNGLCDGFYAQNTTMLQGFHGVDNAVCQLGFNTQQGFNGTNMAIAQLGYQNQNCCCETNRNIDSVRYENARNTCDITTAIHAEGEQTRALINANTMQDLRDRLEARDRDLLAANFQISQNSQTANLIDQLRPCPIPAYLSCSPYTSYDPFRNGYGYGYGNGYGYNNGCGCNSGCCGCNA